MKDRLRRSLKITFFSFGVKGTSCYRFSLKRNIALCHFILFYFIIHEKCLFIISIHLYSLFFPSFKMLKRNILMFTLLLICVWAISIVHFLFFLVYSVNLRTKSMMGKYIEYVLLWKFVKSDI